MKKLSYKWILLILSMVIILIWFYFFPLKLPFDWYDILFEGLYLFTIIISYFFVMRLHIKVLEIGWSIFTYGFLIDFLDEFTSEPDILNTHVEGVLKISGLALIAIGLYLSQKKLQDELAKSRQMEETLREREERFRLLAENAQDLIYRYRMTPKRGFEYVSPSATAITGYTPEEHYADPDLGLKLVHPEDRPLLEGYFNGGGIFGQPIALRWLRKDGKIIWTEQRNVPIYDEAGNLVAIEGIARDITERMRTEEALRESEEKYRQLFELESDAIFLIDKETGRILKVNAAASALYGYSREELLQKKNTDLSAEPEKTRKATLEQWTRVPLRFHRKKDGTVFPVEIAASHFTLGGRQVHIAAIRDITERRQMEEEREKLILKLQEALANVKTLSGLLPICASCKKIRDDEGYWHQVEAYIQEHSDAVFTHGICPDCLRKLYPEFYGDKEEQKK